ncbi:sensor histidine kinase [Pseudoalteromonas aurantia]|nr:histidine kinase [Pseudoalteromonas aurantia]
MNKTTQGAVLRIRKFLLLIQAPKEYFVLQCFIGIGLVIWLVQQGAFYYSNELVVIGGGLWMLATIDVLHFLLLTHLCLKPFIDVYVFKKPLTALSAISSIGLVVFVSLLQIGLTTGHSIMWHSLMISIWQQVDTSLFFNTADLQQLLFTFILPISNYIIMFIVWCVCYSLACAYADRKRVLEQLKLLQSTLLLNQLNPHFLFNSFNSIRALIHEDQYQAEEMLLCLSDLFREQLQFDRTPIASLEEEWDIAQRYVNIEKIRFEEKLNLNMQIAPECWGCRLPTFTLLSLLENAIKFGIGGTHAHEVVLKAQLINEHRWQLRIENMIVRQVQVYGTGTGLKNLKRRLKLLYGHSGYLHYYKQAGQFIVILELERD